MKKEGQMKGRNSFDNWVVKEKKVKRKFRILKDK